MKLYELAWGPYPRRIGIYLAEKGIDVVERIAFDALDGWPPPELARLSPLGTVPVLESDDGTVIRSSIAILDYLEELFPAPDMIGAGSGERARTRELISVIDEAATHFGVWCHKASPLFAGRETQSREAAAFAADAYAARMRLLDQLASETNGPFLAGPRVTIADCIAGATIQFAERFYGVPLSEGCPVLTAWYATFSLRPSMAAPAHPEPLLALAYGLPRIVSWSSAACAPRQTADRRAMEARAHRDVGCRRANSLVVRSILIPLACCWCQPRPGWFIQSSGMNTKLHAIADANGRP